jgi:four helix bundle protein
MHAQTQALLDRLVAFGVRSSVLARDLRREVAGDHLARQLVRSATSVAANYAEACDAESRADFVHKMRIVLKELREASTWVATARGLRKSPQFDALAAECNELISIFVASIKTAQSKSGPNQKSKV